MPFSLQSVNETNEEHKLARLLDEVLSFDMVDTDCSTFRRELRAETSTFHQPATLVYIHDCFIATLAATLKRYRTIPSNMGDT